MPFSAAVPVPNGELSERFPPFHAAIIPAYASVLISFRRASFPPFPPKNPVLAFASVFSGA
jgi:hypothetical protein